MNYLKKLLSPSENKKVEITFQRNVMLDGRHWSAGETASFSERQAGEAVACGAAIDPAGQAAAVSKAETLKSQLPAPIMPAPVPKSWTDLPASFSSWFALKEARRVLIVRRDAIEDRLMEFYVGKSPNFSHSLTALPPEVSAKIFQTMDFGINTGIDADLAQLRFLKDALHRAEEAVQAWNKANHPTLIKLELECSTHTQDVHAELAKAARDLHAKGRELFSIRLSALGLGEHKLAALYEGSADNLKYGSIPIPGLSDLKLAYSDGGSNPVFYLGVSPRTMVGMIAQWTGTLAEVETLAKQADRELAAAKKVSSKAA